MKNILLLAIITILTSCTGKVHNLVSFTRPISPDNIQSEVLIGEKKPLSSWISKNPEINISLDNEGMNFVKQHLDIEGKISAQPVIINNKILLLTSTGHLYAFEKESLKKLWSTNLLGVKTKNSYLGGGIAVQDGKIFATNGSRKFSILSEETGELLFSKQFLDLLITKPLIHNDIAILQTLSNQSFFFDLNSKIVLLDHTATPENLVSGEYIAPKLVGNNMAIISYSSGQTTMMDLSNKQEIWALDLSINNNLPEYVPTNLSFDPIIEDENLYLASNNGKLLKIDLPSGSIIWEKEIDDIRTINNTINSLILTTNGRQVIALEKNQGKVIWTTELADKNKSKTKWNPIDYVGSVMINDHLNIFTKDGTRYRLSKDGNIVSKTNIKGKIHYIAVEDKIYLFSDKKLYISK